MNNKKLLMMTEIAIFAAIGLVLDQLSFKIVPQGGSISLVMLPIVIIAIRWGLGAGLISGFLVGVLQMMFGAYILHWAQALLDYVVAFTAIGLAGVMRPTIIHAMKNEKITLQFIYIVAAIMIGGIIRFIAHLLAGVIFFKEYAGDQNPWIYSTIYNCTYIIPSIILTAIVAVLLLKASPKLIQIAK